MSHELVIPAEVEGEIADTYDSFQDAAAALGFIQDLNIVFERISNRPRQFPVAYEAMHRALLRHHEYSVFFEIDELRARVVIHALIHQHRDPQRWPK